MVVLGDGGSTAGLIDLHDNAIGGIAGLPEPGYQFFWSEGMSHFVLQSKRPSGRRNGVERLTTGVMRPEDGWTLLPCPYSLAEDVVVPCVSHFWRSWSSGNAYCYLGQIKGGKEVEKSSTIRVVLFASRQGNWEIVDTGLSIDTEIGWVFWTGEREFVLVGRENDKQASSNAHFYRQGPTGRWAEGFVVEVSSPSQDGQEMHVGLYQVCRVGDAYLFALPTRQGRAIEWRISRMTGFSEGVDQGTQRFRAVYLCQGASFTIVEKDAARECYLLTGDNYSCR